MSVLATIFLCVFQAKYSYFHFKSIFNLLLFYVVPPSFLKRVYW